MYRQLISLHVKRYFSERNSEMKDRDLFYCKKDEDTFDLVIAFLFGI